MFNYFGHWFDIHYIFIYKKSFWLSIFSNYLSSSFLNIFKLLSNYFAFITLSYFLDLFLPEEVGVPLNIHLCLFHLRPLYFYNWAFLNLIIIFFIIINLFILFTYNIFWIIIFHYFISFIYSLNVGTSSVWLKYPN